MAKMIINGRQIDVPSPNDVVRGSDIIERVNPRDNRRVVKQRGLEAETISPDRTYKTSDFLDDWGRPVKVTDMPDRTKGSFWGIRSPSSKAVITEQVYDMAQHCFKAGVNFDEENADWMIVPDYRLPSVWRNTAQTTELMVVFPTEYPVLPPIGCYLKATLPGAPDGHLFQHVYHDAAQEPIQNGWKWYCVYVKPGSWQPAVVRYPGDWKRGDNLWTYFMLIKEALSSKGA
jgi:hypothetical protein